MTNKQKTLKLNGKPVDFTYTNEVTTIEHTFLRSFFEKRDYEGLIYYLEDCVLWKRQNYFDLKKKTVGGGFNV